MLWLLTSSSDHLRGKAALTVTAQVKATKVAFSFCPNQQSSSTEMV